MNPLDNIIKDGQTFIQYYGDILPTIGKICESLRDSLQFIEDNKKTLLHIPLVELSEQFEKNFPSAISQRVKTKVIICIQDEIEKIVIQQGSVQKIAKMLRTLHLKLEKSVTEFNWTEKLEHYYVCRTIFEWTDKCWRYFDSLSCTILKIITTLRADDRALVPDCPDVATDLSVILKDFEVRGLLEFIQRDIVPKKDMIADLKTF